LFKDLFSLVFLKLLQSGKIMIYYNSTINSVKLHKKFYLYMGTVMKLSIKNIMLSALGLGFTLQLYCQELSPVITSASQEKSWKDTLSNTASSLGSTVGSWLSSGASSARRYLGKISPNQWLDSAGKLVNSATASGRDAFNYIADLSADTPALTGQALRKAKVQLHKTLNTATALLDTALNANEQLAAKGGVPAAYQRAAAVTLLGVESAAVAFGLYRIMGLLSSALSAADAGKLSVSDAAVVLKETENNYIKAIQDLQKRTEFAGVIKQLQARATGSQ
jgi:hypothetical protein